MILVEIILFFLLLSVLTGGSFKRLAAEPLKGEWVLLTLLPVQLLWPAVSEYVGLPCATSLVVWLFMMAGLAAVLMANASRRWQLAIAALGIAANILVIGTNQGMPVSLKAASEVGMSRDGARRALAHDCLHEATDDRTHMVVLADVIGIPGPSWQRSVISLGDALLSLGLGAWVFAAARTSRRPTRD